MRDFNEYEQKMLNQSKEWLGSRQGHTQIPESLSREGHIAKMGETFATYFQLLRHCNKGTGQCFPSVEQIAGESGLSVSTVKRHIVKLEKLGYIIICRSKARRKNGTIKNDVNRYILVPTFILGNRVSKEPHTQQSDLQEEKKAKASKPATPISAISATSTVPPPAKVYIGCPPPNMLLNPEIPEGELEKARHELETVRELEGLPELPKWFNADRIIEDMMKNIRKFGYKPGYVQLACNRLKATPTYSEYNFVNMYWLEYHIGWDLNRQ